MKFALALALGLSFANIAFAGGHAAMPVNLDFEVDGRTGVSPYGWRQAGSGYSAYTTNYGVSGHFGLAISVSQPEHTFGGIVQCIPALNIVGRTVTLTGAISTWMVTDGYAGLWLRVDGPNGQVIFLDNMSDRPITGTTSWGMYGSAVAVPYTATQICYGAINTGFGNAYVDYLNLSIYSR